jgi:Xaa-Pro aminopeptidase
MKPVRRDVERVRRNTQPLIDAGLDAFVCVLPINVLLLTGYWPVVGTSVAISTREGQVLLLVPEDELQLARLGWADDLTSYSAGSLADLRSISEILAVELGKTAAALRIGSIGFESEAVSLPVPYAAVSVFGWSIAELLRRTFAAAKLVPGGRLLAGLRSVLTPGEIERVRHACKIAEAAYVRGREKLSTGLTEIEAAKAFRERLSPDDLSETMRADGYAFCMSGENSYLASAAFQLSRTRRLRGHDLALIHCNSYADGFWTDITRTYCIGEPDDRQRMMYDAIFLAGRAALDAIAPGVAAAHVDSCAREVMIDHGFGDAFKHGLGHSVGFAAIDHNAPPRLHPASPDKLETGMVFNIEPAVYIKAVGGMRHCDMAAVTDRGAELLTPFQADLESMIVRC